MQMIVGYKLLDANDAVVQNWGGVWGQAPNMPAMLILPNGDHVHAPTLDMDYSGCRLVYWYMDEPPPPVLKNISKNIIWERMTDDEAAQTDAMLEAQTPKIKRIYEGATYISVKAAEYPLLLGAMTQMFGAQRAAEILKPNF